MLSTSYISEETKKKQLRLPEEYEKLSEWRLEIRVVLGSTRYLTTRVKKRLRKHWGKGALCTQRSQIRRTRAKGFLGREGDTLNKEP